MEYEGHAISDVIEYSDHTAYGGMLEALLQAIRRLKDTVGISVHVNNAVLAAQISNGAYRQWSANDGRTTRGSPVKEWQLWQSIYTAVDMTDSVLMTADTEIPREKTIAMRFRIEKR